MSTGIRRAVVAFWGVVASVAASIAGTAQAATWVEGQNYYLIQPAQPTNVPAGKVEVVEVFSYGCPACYRFFPYADKLKASLPKNAVMSYLPAAWSASEDWPMFQRAYLTASALGVADKTHDAMFNAVWGSGELATMDVHTNKLKSPLPSIEDAAKFYARVAGVKPEQFLSAAKSFSIDMRMKSADATVKAYRVDSTPTIVVNGKYRLTPQSAGGYDQLIELVNYLVTKESK